ncbi:Cysteine-rich CWC [Saccharicrinis carchari]|uniref:Cysteine-rich CWC n=1 Tax=Saccharicrinis carchari TaxID=1168039 RepID=A0A521AJX6_SACCC|nr:Cysteine-rich CWC [Saccharicrinis carchari]
MKKKCPRCKGSFECKGSNIQKCQCKSIKLSSQAYQFIRDNYTDCLCLACLQQIEKERQCSPKLSAVPNNQ